MSPARWKASASRGFVVKVNVLGRFCGDDVPVIAVQALAVNHLLGCPILHLHIGGMGEAALETHLGFEKPDHF